MINEKNTSRRMHRIIDAWIDIDAKPEEIWEVLLDFKSWELWNPFIPLVEGNLQIGEHLRIKVSPPGMKSMILNQKFMKLNHMKKFFGAVAFSGFSIAGTMLFYWKLSLKIKRVFDKSKDSWGLWFYLWAV
jgi:hypothetical protein